MRLGKAEVVPPLPPRILPRTLGQVLRPSPDRQMPWSLGALSMQVRKMRLHVLKQRSCCSSPEPSSSRGTLALFCTPLLSLPWPYAALNIPVCLFSIRF